MSEIRVSIHEATPIRTTPALVWLVEFDEGHQADDLIFLTGPDVTAPDVIRMLGHMPFKDDLPVQRKDGKMTFTIRNITLGAWWIKKQAGDAYFNDARAVDQDGMVQV